MWAGNFSDDLKRGAVRRVALRGYLVQQVSRRLDIGNYIPGTWLELLPEPALKPNSVGHETENQGLKRSWPGSPRTTIL